MRQYLIDIRLYYLHVFSNKSLEKIKVRDGELRDSGLATEYLKRYFLCLYTHGEDEKSCYCGLS